MRDFRKLKVWEKAHDLTLSVYHATSRFPRGEQFGLTSQLRRASASIPANIAEGCGREGNAELARFCIMAAGSASELEYHLPLSRDLNLLASQDFQHLTGELIEVKRMLVSFVQKLRANS
ncbi:MAG: four helix bundle protein [Chloroflexi bacterium]|nr:four helix bundle protein [Chloroflexota bacterium]